MAKKTRAQKIATSERKQSFSETTETNFTVAPSKGARTTETVQDKEIKKYFFLDLRKSLIVVLVILGFELALYFL